MEDETMKSILLDSYRKDMEILHRNLAEIRRCKDMGGDCYYLEFKRNSALERANQTAYVAKKRFKDILTELQDIEEQIAKNYDR